MNISPLNLGATLYMPATRHDIIDVILANKIPNLQSMVICLEDAVSEEDVVSALSNLKKITDELAPKRELSHKPLVFVRPRNIPMAKEIVNNYNLTGINGFVFPKFTLATLTEWEKTIESSHLTCMPTLETEEVFDVAAMQRMAETLTKSSLRKKIIAIRVGGNDLMGVLGIRRSRITTIYEGPLSYILKMLACTFGAKGFALTAPVFELIDQIDLLELELLQDISHGFIGKTAIHPSQIEYIHNALMVEPSEFEDATRILESSQAVYKHGGAMCEPATHHQWAKKIVERHAYYGLRDENSY